jgi:zinc protease
MLFDRKIKPAPNQEINFNLPEIGHQFTHGRDDELEIFFVEKNNLPLIQVNLVINSGSKLDPDGKKGLSNLTAMAIDEGAGKYDSLQLSDEFDILGSSFSVSSDEDLIIFSLKTLKENFSRSLELLKLVLNEPRFAEKDFEREKRKILIRLLQLKDDPDQIADILLDELIFTKQNPYSYPTAGNDDNLKNIEIANVNNFYEQYFHIKNSALFIVGDITENEIISNSNQLGLIKSNELVNNTKLNFPDIKKNKTRIYIFHKENSVQSEIRVGHISNKRDEKDYYAKLVMNNILGGQFSSRINLNLRERKGYTYGAFSRFNYFKDAGYFYVSTSVGIENTANAVKEIMLELNEIKNGVKKEELEFSKSSIIRRFPSNFETNKQVVSNLISKYLFDLPQDYFNNYLDKIKHLTIEEVNNSAKEDIFTENLTIIVVGDKNKIKSELENLEAGEVAEVNLNGEIID